MADFVFDMDEGAVKELLNTPDGPVGGAIGELSQKATEIARRAAPVMKPWNYSFAHPRSSPFNYSVRRFDPRYQYGPPGATTEATHIHFPAYNKLGQLYGGVNTLFAPTLFLERPARQIHSLEYRFMTQALDSLEF